MSRRDGQPPGGPAAALGALLLGEHLTLATLLGSAVVLVSVALLLLHRLPEPGERHGRS